MFLPITTLFPLFRRKQHSTQFESGSTKRKEESGRQGREGESNKSNGKIKLFLRRNARSLADHLTQGQGQD